MATNLRLHWRLQKTHGKFDRNVGVLCIYFMIPRNMHWDVKWVHERYNKF
jgi:hypothetical protein